MTSPARSYFGCQPGSAIVAGRTSTPATTVTLTDTTHPRLYQRVGTSKTITVSGTSNGTRIQARACPVGNGLTQDETLYPFVDIATNHAGGAFSLPLAVPQGDGWVVQVRDGVTHTLGSTGTHTFGVGVFIALIGQSNMENLFGAYAGAFTGAKGAYTHHGSFARLGNINDNFPPNTLIDMNNGHGSDYVASGYTSDPGSYIGTAITLLGNTLVASLGCPVVLLPYAASGSSINDWQPGQAYSNALLNDVDTIGGDFELALWLQGENDAAGMSAATYQGKLQTLFDSCKSHTGRATDFHFGVVIVGPALSAAGVWGAGWGVSETFKNIRQAQMEFVAANGGNGAFLAGTDIDGNLADASPVHIDTPSLFRQACRYAEAIKRRLSGATNNIEGPSIASASRSGNVITVNVTQYGGSALVGTGQQAFRVFEAGTPVTISSSAVVGSTITLTLASTPSGEVTMDYAMANAPFGSTTTGAVVCYDNQTIPGDSRGLPLQPKPLFTVSQG